MGDRRNAYLLTTPACLDRPLASRIVITVATWNVLHRVHAENWHDDGVSWPDEPIRIAAISAQLSARPETVIALQEVSGDQLASLRTTFPHKTIHALRYPRIPRLRRGAPALHDPTEHLVLLVDRPTEELAAESFPNDPGNGFLAVELDSLIVVTTHITGDERRVEQLTRLKELVDAHPDSPLVIVGDFNTDRDTVGAALGDTCTVADLPPGTLPTRPRTSGPKSQFIDHIVTRNTRAINLAVHPANGLSDHNLVRATLIT
ncbi:endonuclease/exonuclease/phosphatase family protein [Nocardia sp. NPDC052566]|uniref:endonuclease/exonuclease/phosphatase family protein n=1 Tax=Nocardia sp. NPDC052566 TaxID=3364330 RepID=UPI0037CC7FA4